MKQLFSVLPYLSIILIAVLLRLLPHPANVAPIGALALFSGAYVAKKYAFFLPLGAMFLSDLILGFHSTMLFVYASFLLIGLLGYLTREHKTVLRLGSLSLVSSTLFFFITNTGVWLTTPTFVYAKTWNGFLACLAAGIPFFRNTILGDLVYLGAFCLIYTLLKHAAGTLAQKEIYANLYKER